jgi:hypothetical protein
MRKILTPFRLLFSALFRCGKIAQVAALVLTTSCTKEKAGVGIPLKGDYRLEYLGAFDCLTTDTLYHWVAIGQSYSNRFEVTTGSSPSTILLKTDSLQYEAVLKPDGSFAGARNHPSPMLRSGYFKGDSICIYRFNFSNWDWRIISKGTRKR